MVALGASLYDILTAVKNDARLFPKLEISFSSALPLATPVVVNLTENGIRLRFDGPDQRLRLIEVLDFRKMRFTYKNDDILPRQDNGTPVSSQLLYRRVYQLFGPSYPGEYLPPATGSTQATYVLSFPGIALSFPLQPTAWSPKVDHATMLSSSAAAVTSIALFQGNSWPESRKHLFSQKPSLPRSLSLAPRHKESTPDEIEFVNVFRAGKIELLRRSSQPVYVTLNESTAQDLITDLGPPDTIYKRPEQMDDTPRKPMRRERRRSSGVVRGSYGSTPSSVSSTNTDTYDADFEEDDGVDGPDVLHTQEQYYCYFQHGFDILLGPPTETSPMPWISAGAGSHQGQTRPSAGSSTVVATRIVLHGNVPGSYSFNQHRRCRWSLEHLQKPNDRAEIAVTSESKFNAIHAHLLQAYKGIWPEKDMKEGMVIVRDWGGDSPSGSAILIGGEMDEDEEESNDLAGEQWLKNTQLYKFPGLMFEVMHNGTISALTVY